MKKNTFRKWFAPHIMLLVGACFWAGLASADPVTNLPYASWSDDFEAYTLNTPLIDGINGWYGSDDSIVVQDAVVYEGSQAAIIPSDTTLSNRFEQKTPTNVWVQMDAKVARYSGSQPPAVPAERAVMFYVDSDGYLMVHDGAASPTPNWVRLSKLITGEDSPQLQDGDWVRLNVHQDFANKKWTLFANYNLLTNDIGFISDSITCFAGFDLYNGASASYLDNAQVLISNPPALATNGANWLPALAVDTTSITQKVFKGQNPAAGTFKVQRTAGYYPLNFTITSNQTWLQPTPATGSSSGEQNSIAVNYATASLEGGVYTGKMTVAGADASFGFAASDSPCDVEVIMQVMDLQVTPGSLNSAVMLGNTPAVQTFIVTNAGAGSFNYSVSTNASWLSVSPVAGTLSANQGQEITVTYASTAGWAAGVSNAQITVSSGEGGGASRALPVTVEVMDLQVTPGSLNSAVMLGNTPAVQTFIVTNAGSGSFSYSLSTNASWLSVSPAAGTLGANQGQEITVTYASTAGWTPGVSNAQITVSSGEGGGASQPVAVSLAVMDLQVDPTSLSSAVMLGNTPAVQTFIVTNAGAGSFNYSVSTNASWLSVSPAAGTLGANQGQEITVTYASTAGWTPGASNAQITVSSGDGGGASRALPVTVEVMDLQVTPGSLNSAVMLGQTPAEQTFIVTNAGAGSFSYSVSTNASWLSVSPVAGTLGANQGQEITVTYASTAGWAAGASNAQITVSSTEGGGATQTVAVSLAVMDLQVDPTSLSSAVMLGNTPADQTFFVTNAGSGSFHYNVDADASWLSMNPAAGTLNANQGQEITVTYASTAGWAAGVSNAQISVAAGEGGGATQTVAVSLAVMDLQVDPTSLSSAVMLGNTPADQTFFVTNAGSGSFDYNVDADASWLSMNPAAGTLNANQGQEITVTYASTAGWTPGVSNAQISVSANEGGGATQTVAVSLSIQEILPPTGVTASKGTYTDRVQVTWDAVSNATGYQVWRNTEDNTTTANLLDALALTAYTDTAAQPDITYYYWVKATGDVGISPFSLPDTGYVTKGDQPTNQFAVSQGLRREIRVDWPPVAGASRYELWRNLKNDLSGADQLTSDLQTSYRDLAVDPAQTYYYWLKIISDLSGTEIQGPETGWCSGRKWDFRGDGRANAWYYHENSGRWYVELEPPTLYTLVFGGAGLTAVPEDYDGDGKADPAIYEQSSGNWYVLFSGSDYKIVSVARFGGPGYQAVPGDYDGDGKTDPAIYEESRGAWHFLMSASGYGVVSVAGWGAPGYQAVPADYDGDGKTDPAVYHAASGNWFLMLSTRAYVPRRINFGAPGYAPVPGEYNGLGHAEIAVYNAETGDWFALPDIEAAADINYVQFGAADYVPCAADYDGDGYEDVAVFYRGQHDAEWHLLQSREGYRIISGREGRPR